MTTQIQADLDVLNVKEPEYTFWAQQGEQAAVMYLLGAGFERINGRSWCHLDKLYWPNQTEWAAIAYLSVEHEYGFFLPGGPAKPMHPDDEEHG